MAVLTQILFVDGFCYPFSYSRQHNHPQTHIVHYPCILRCKLLAPSELIRDYGILDSLRPLYSVEKWENDIFSIILRVLSFGLFIYYCHSIYVEPDFYLGTYFYVENFESAKDIVKDVHDWGVDKIKRVGR